MKEYSKSTDEEISSIFAKVEAILRDGLAERSACSDEVSAMRDRFVALEARLNAMEDDLVRIMSHSKWLLRLLLGGIVLLTAEFLLEGELFHDR